jgi:hypothetical protein
MPHRFFSWASSRLLQGNRPQHEINSPTLSSNAFSVFAATAHTHSDAKRVFSSHLLSLTRKGDGCMSECVDLVLSTSQGYHDGKYSPTSALEIWEIFNISAHQQWKWEKIAERICAAMRSHWWGAFFAIMAEGAHTYLCAWCTLGIDGGIFISSKRELSFSTLPAMLRIYSEKFGQ